MDMSGEYRISAPRKIVWAGLNDPDMLKRCLPGCESLVMIDDTHMNAVVIAKIGPVKAKFKGAVILSEIVAPERYVISGEGTGGAAGFASGSASVVLAQDGQDTILTYEAQAKVGGKLAQIGSRLIDAAAKKMADDFFGRLAMELGRNSAEQANEGGNEGGTAEHLPAPDDEGRARQVIISTIVLIGVAAIAYWLFGG